MSKHEPLPAAWVERIFSRFSAVWGVQKIGAMFPPESHDEVRSVWAEQLGRYSGQTIGAALQAVVDSGAAWPPTLPEFLEACRRSSLERVAHAPAVMLPRPTPNQQLAQAAIAKAAQSVSAVRPGREWAHKLLARHESGERLSNMQLRMARAAVEFAGSE